MPTDEAVMLILRIVGSHDLSDRLMRESGKAVVLTLGCLALAIAQAGAVIWQGRYETGQYCDLYSRRQKELLSQKAIQGGDDYRYTVYTTWEVSQKMIEEMSSEVGQDALRLLQIFGFFHYEGIPEEIFQRGWNTLRKNTQSDWMLLHQSDILLRQCGPEWDVYPLRAAVSVLLSFSLVSHSKDNLISIHPLVHRWTRDRLSPEEEEIWTQTASMMALSIPWTFQMADYRFRQSLVPHLDACLGNQKDGIFHVQKIGKDCQRMASGFALAYSEVGRGQEALQLTERVVEADKRTLGEEHPDTLSSMHSLANRYSEMGRGQEALQLTERVVEASKRTLGEEHPDTLSSMHNLATSYSEMGRGQEALQLTERVMEARKRILGEEHPDTLRSIRTMIFLTKTLQNTTEAHLQLSSAEVKFQTQHACSRKRKAYSPFT